MHLVCGFLFLLTLTPRLTLLNRLIAQSALQPGVLTLYKKILQLNKQIGFRCAPEELAQGDCGSA
jgi:hypothetical protein